MTRDETRPMLRTSEIRSFGRRRGRKLSARQERLLAELLPKVAVDPAKPPFSDLRELFEPALSAVWLEIGFGGAEHLLWQARTHPDVGLIGCEPFEEGVVKALTTIDEEGLCNIRLLEDDVRPLLRWLPERSLSRVFILFPDPWPKKRHQKRRLFSPDLLRLLARVMVRSSGNPRHVLTTRSDGWIQFEVNDQGTFTIDTEYQR